MLLLQGPHFEDTFCTFLCTCGSQPYLIIRITWGTQMPKQTKATFKLHLRPMKSKFLGMGLGFKKKISQDSNVLLTLKTTALISSASIQGDYQRRGKYEWSKCYWKPPHHRNQHLFKHRMWKCFCSRPPLPHLPSCHLELHRLLKAKIHTMAYRGLRGPAPATFPASPSTLSSRHLKNI